VLTRRTFIGWLGSVGSAIGFGARTRLPGADPPADSQATTLDSSRVTRLGEAVLPTELGESGIGRVSRAFAQWAGNHRRGAELVHPYGSTNIRFTSESPVSRWRAQLDELDQAARARHRRVFSSLTPAQRREIVADALADDGGSRMPDPGGARHVALALLSWFFASPEATNLCYRARIDRNQCRPLVHSAREPLPLLSRASGTGDQARGASDSGTRE